MDNKTTTYLTTLTPLSGIAAMLVVIFHCNLMMQTFLPPGYTALLDSAWLWVDFFFVLSGFIMSYVYGNYFKTGTTASTYKKFIGARFARVYPLHFVTLVLAIINALIILHFANGIEPFFSTLLNVKYGAPASLFLLQAMHLFSTAPLNTPSWSLSTEWWVYIIFPFFVPLFAKLKMMSRIVVLLFIIAYFIIIRYWLGPYDDIFTHQPTLNMISGFAIFRCLGGFLLGMLLYSFYEAKVGYAILKNSWCFILFFLGALVAMHFAVMDIIIVAFFPVILLTAAYNNTGVKRFLDRPVMQRLGDWSFSIYMIHMPLIMFTWIYHIYKDHTYFSSFEKLVSQPPNYGLGIVLCLSLIMVTLTLSALAYRYIEVPARNYLNNVFDTKSKKIVAPSPLFLN